VQQGLGNAGRTIAIPAKESPFQRKVVIPAKAGIQKALT